MLSATGQWNPHGFPFAIDNGAWHAFQQGAAWDELRFRELLSRIGVEADFVVIPDIVCGGMESLAFSLEWLPMLEWLPGKRLLAVQDGMEPGDVAGVVSDEVGIFVGGSTEWKEATIRTWGEFKRETGCYLHVGRVNTVRRLNKCIEAGADSVDGTSATRFAVNIPKLSNAAMQMRLFQ